MRTKPVTPTLEIKGLEKVILVEGGMICDMRDVPHGKEFIHEGSRWQSVGIPLVYSRVPVGSRFKYADSWLYRVSEDAWPQCLAPNGPFGDRVQKTMRVTEQSQVMLSSIEYRGSL